MENLSVKTIIGQHAYAVITWPNGAQMDIRLESGMGVPQSLEKYAQEQESRARDAQRKADIARKAALVHMRPEPPTPLFVTAPSGAYAFKCELGDVVALGDTSQEAQENWKAAWIAENIG